jgi:hypothetical protein
MISTLEPYALYNDEPDLHASPSLVTHSHLSVSLLYRMYHT